MIRVVAIQFTPAGKLYDFNAGTLELKPGDRVVVETERGSGLGTVVTTPKEVPEEQVTTPLAQVRRLLGPEDDRTLQHHARREKEARDFCIRRIKERGLDMKLVRVEYLFDGSKAIFYFTADGRIDFRELVKDLAHTFHTRIEMRQIGVRDEAKMVGGLGVCGRELCCASFLRDFQPVSVKMAKEQNLALNPNKISGQCGRLLCCLDYEYETYCSLRKNFPKCGKHVRTAQTGGTVEKLNLLTGELILRQGDGKQVAVRVTELLDENSPLLPPQPEPTAPAGGGAQHPRREQQQKRPRPQQALAQQQAPRPEPAPATAPPAPEANADPAAKGEEKAKRRKRNRRHGNRKNRDQKPDAPPSQE
ncbi:PSP1 domain-containing protein [Trichlorobacter ammonificans]|uniref:Signal peptidase-like protein n=1 Tax=Trichlorobacter ammonificans TaxID=2916410 RepID=A0ABM9D8F9_9BACT|nr:stage 0 sporulation family protein [Trichlorobacter ammonificans]CAH2031516.1 Signal peptidase-like protein [Trichlorobacter ammonificans]